MCNGSGISHAHTHSFTHMDTDIYGCSQDIATSGKKRTGYLISDNAPIHSYISRKQL